LNTVGSFGGWRAGAETGGRKGPQEAGLRTQEERRLAEAGGDGLERGGVLGGRTHGPDRGVERAGGRGEREGFGLRGAGMFRERLGDDGHCALAEQGADVAAAEGEVRGTQAASVRCAQGREQEKEAGEMAVPETHTLSMLNEMRVELVD
jgi:hypothetical protein